MTLNHDCIRDILLALEDSLQIDNEGRTGLLSSEDLIKLDNMKLYSRADVIYCSFKLRECGYIDISVHDADNKLYKLIYNHITFQGHQYLDAIRDKGIWDKTKERMAKAGNSAPLTIIFETALSILQKQIGL